MKPALGRAIDGQTGPGASRPHWVANGVNERVGAVRGFLKGVSLGGVIAVGGLAFVSQLAGPGMPPTAMPQGDEAPSAVPVTVNDSAVAPAQSDSAEVPASPDQKTGTQMATAPESATTQEPAAEPLSADPPVTAAETPPVALTDAPATPEGNTAAEVTGAVPAPSPDATPAAEVAAAPRLSADADTTLSAPPQPAEPPARPLDEAPADQLASADTGAEATATLPQTNTSGEPAASLPRAPGAPKAETAPSAAELPPPPPLTPEEEALLQPLPDAEIAEPAQTTEAAPEPQIADATPFEPPATDAPAPLPPVSAGEPADPLPRAEGLTDQAEGVVTGRLPRIGAAESAPAAETSTETTTETTTGATPEVAVIDPQGLPPLERYARPFENPDAKPLFAILLVDDGKGDVNRAELAALSLPLTIVIDPLSEGAAAREAIWRAGGQEVVLSVSGIPAGATASDLEQTFQQLLDRLPESLAVIDPDGRMFQDNRPLATMVVPILKAEGMGLVTYDRGLNAADQVARRDGLGSTRIFRRLDAEDEAAPVIRRYLDRAAFKAAQEGQVAVIGALRGETIKAVMEWAVEGRSATVALAPVSALMRR